MIQSLSEILTNAAHVELIIAKNVPNHFNILTYRNVSISILIVFFENLFQNVISRLYVDKR